MKKGPTKFELGVALLAPAVLSTVMSKVYGDNLTIELIDPIAVSLLVVGVSLLVMSLIDEIKDKDSSA